MANLHMLFRAFGKNSKQTRPQKTPAFFQQTCENGECTGAISGIWQEIKTDTPSKNSRVFSTDMRKWRMHVCYFGHLAIQKRQLAGLGAN